MGTFMSDLTAALAEALGNLEEDAFNEALDEIVANNPNSDEAQAVVDACAKGMETVGNYYEEGEYFVGDLIYAADILQGGFEKLAPFLTAEDAPKTGVLVLGSAPGDLHDIGKNIFKSMAEAAGFQVVDLGVDVPAETFAEKVKETNADIVGISGLLTLSLDTMGDVVKACQDAGVRDNVKILIGGNPVTDAVANRIGADAASNNASVAVKLCKEWMGA